jgi:hypothetical protein
MSFLGALGRLDFDAAASLLDEGAVLDLPYINDGLIVRGRADILQFFRQSMSKSVSGIVYRLEQAYPSPEAGAYRSGNLDARPHCNGARIHQPPGRDFRVPRREDCAFPGVFLFSQDWVSQSAPDAADRAGES